MKRFPVIDPVATGRNISRLRRAKGLSVRDVQQWFGFEEPQAIYKWQQGKNLPSVDNLYALCTLLEVTMEELLVEQSEEDDEDSEEEQQGSLLLSDCRKTLAQRWRTEQRGKCEGGKGPPSRLIKYGFRTFGESSKS